MATCREERKRERATETENQKQRNRSRETKKENRLKNNVRENETERPRKTNQRNVRQRNRDGEWQREKWRHAVRNVNYTCFWLVVAVIVCGPGDGVWPSLLRVLRLRHHCRQRPQALAYWGTYAVWQLIELRMQSNNLSRYACCRTPYRGTHAVEQLMEVCTQSVESLIELCTQAVE